MINMLSVRPSPPDIISPVVDDGAASDQLPLCGVCEDPMDEPLFKETCMCCALGEDHEPVDMKHALLQDPIVGVERVVLDENGPGAIEPKPLASPSNMTPAQREKHNLAHLQYHPGCTICVAIRRANTAHARSHEQLRVIPRVVAD